MTNREWLETLDYETLAYVMVHLRDFASWHFHNYTDTVTGITEWLNEEHQDD